MKILVADDHAIFRRGLIAVLNDEIQGLDFDEAGNGKELIEMALKNKYGVIISDINMPQKTGLECVKELNNLKITTPILVLSMHSAVEYELRALRVGAFGYLNKENTSESITGAVKKIIGGEKYFSTNALNISKTSKKIGTEKQLHQKLSDREFEIFKMMVKGFSGNDICENLHLKKSTISTFKKRIFEKMERFNIPELTKYAIEKGIV